MSSAQARAGARPAAGQQLAAGTEKLLGIGEAAAKTGVSERALRYYQQLGLLTPCGCTPGGLRRYSDADLARVDRIRQLQTLLGLNLDEISAVLRGEDRMNQIRQAYHQQDASDAERRELVTESLELQQQLRGTVESKRQAIEGFLADLDAQITRTREFLRQMTESAASPAGDAVTADG